MGTSASVRTDASAGTGASTGMPTLAGTNTCAHMNNFPDSSYENLDRNTSNEGDIAKMTA